MSEITTVKVRTTTRDRLRAAAHPGTADEVINRAMDALDREQLRRRMQEQAHQVSADPDERREITAITADLEWLAGGIA